MNVLFLQNTLYDYRVPFFNGLVRKGFNVTVVHSDKPTTLSRSFEEVIVPMRKVASLRFQSNLPRLGDFDVVVSMFDLHWPLNVLPLLLPRKNRILLWGHGLGRNPTGNKLRTWLVKKSDGIVLYSSKREKDLHESGIAKELTFVANNTIEVANHGLDEQTEQSSFLFVGRLQERKRIDLLLRAFKLLLNKKPELKNLRVDIVGEGEIRPSLESLCKELGLEEHVTFWGKVTANEALKPLFQRAIAYVSPGALGLGINHALAFGTPILSDTDQHHGPEASILGPNNSIMITGRSYQDKTGLFADAMEQLATDTDYRKRLKRQCYEDYVQHCSMDRMIDGFVTAMSPHPSGSDVARIK